MLALSDEGWSLLIQFSDARSVMRWRVCRACFSNHVFNFTVGSLRDRHALDKTEDQNFVIACVLHAKFMQLCPRATGDWSPLNPRCSYPFCRGSGLTGLWVPTRNDGFPPPSADSAWGSESVESWLQRYPDYKFVACSRRCFDNIQSISRKRASEDLVLIATHGYQEPIRWLGPSPSQ